MSIVIVNKTVQQGTFKIEKKTEYDCDSVVLFKKTVPDGSTDLEFVLGIDISELKILSIISTQALTIETNSGSSPDNTKTLVANKEVIYEDGDAAYLTADVDSIFCTNSSGTDAELTIIVGHDA